MKAATPRGKKEQGVTPLREVTAAVREQGVPETGIPVEEADRCRAHAVVLQFDWQQSIQNQLQV